MAKNESDLNATQDMFEPLEKEAIRVALEQYQATLRRKINTEKNPDIRSIYSKELERYNRIYNKTTGWL